MKTPFWIPDAIFYQIFPDRFANGDPSINPPNVKPWGSIPTTSGFQGGDLQGIIQHFDTLLDLGINAIYLNPIFQSCSTHRYNTNDYFRIEPLLGSQRDFKMLLDTAHSCNVRVILDGVFNHCGRGFFAFADLLENQEQSPYQDWFYVNKFPVDAYSRGEAVDYEGWWKHKSLPKLRIGNARVRNYILDVAKYWIDQGIDGWRLDVPNEIDDDAFWADFRAVVKNANPDAYLVGEIWEALPRWVSDGHFDGLMNYPVREALLKFLDGKFTPSQFGEKILRIQSLYARENTFAMLNLLGSHDTERILTLCGENVEKVKLAYLFMMAYPGAPTVYYGDEVGISGGKDPDCRRAFPWNPADWKVDLRQYVKRLISLRKRMPVLRRGEYRPILSEDVKGGFGFFRELGDERVLVLMNRNSTRINLRVRVAPLDWQDGRIVHNLLGDGEYVVSGDTLNIAMAPNSGVWLA